MPDLIDILPQNDSQIIVRIGVADPVTFQMQKAVEVIRKNDTDGFLVRFGNKEMTVDELLNHLEGIH